MLGTLSDSLLSGSPGSQQAPSQEQQLPKARPWREVHTGLLSLFALFRPTSWTIITPSANSSIRLDEDGFTI